MLYQITAVIIHGKNIKSHTKLINLQYQLQQGMKSLNYLMDHSLYQIFKLTSNISFKKNEKVTDNPSLMIHLNKIKKIELRLKLR